MIQDALLGAGSMMIGIIVLFLATTSWRWLALAAALGAGAVGLSAIVRNARADHFEGFVLLIGTALCLQPALALWVLVFRPERSTRERSRIPSGRGARTGYT